MRSVANTLLRIVAWAFVVIGALFALMQVWLLGVSMLLIGAIGVFATDQKPISAYAPNDGSPQQEPQPSEDSIPNHEDWVDYANIDDPQSPLFLSNDEER